MGLGDMLLGVELVGGDGANGVDGRSLRVEGWVVGLQEGPLESRGMKEVLLPSEGVVLKSVNK